ncbi:MAG: SDR family NAD(P)-dependent oxidoreductase [Actinomycetota bacterium]
MHDRSAFGHDTTTEEVLDGIDLTGRRVLITGASGGLGAESARALAAKGASVTVTARDLAKAGAAMAAVAEETGNEVQVEQLDLDDLASIRAFADRFAAAHDALDVLINNAGVMACPQGTTTDGFELQFGTNHLGHFLLTGLLAPTLLAGDAARVVNLSSRAHHRSPVSLDDPAFETTAYDPWVAYGRSKTANVLHAVELDRRLAGRGVRAYAVHPGAIMTDLARHLRMEDIESMRSSRPQLRMKTVPAGAATSVYAATAPELAGQGGVYLEDCGIAEVDDEAPEHGVRSYALDPDTARGLWGLSEQLVGQTFDL